MEFDARVVAVVAAVALTVVLWTAALLLRRVDVRVTARGFRNGAVIAAVLFAITVVIVGFVFNGRAVFVDTLDLAGAIELGVLVGAIVAVGYLWLGATLIAIGLIFKSKPQWTTLGAWAAVPVIVMAGGFGYASFKSVTSDSAAASSANGSLHLSLTGGQSGRISADGAATCTTNADGTRTIDAGITADPHIITGDGRLVSAHIEITPGAPQGELTVSIEGLDMADLATATAVGSNPAAGQMQVSAPPWSGTLSWSCNQ